MANNIFHKLQTARIELQNMTIKKSGQNKFAKYKYYELSDILPHINNIFAKHGLCAVISFGLELATMTIYDTEHPGGTDHQVVITSPMSEAKLSGGCAPVQNLGAVETYQRRYLYMVALEVVENDILDAVTGHETTQVSQQPPKPKSKSKAELIEGIKRGEPLVYDFEPAILKARLKYLETGDFDEAPIEKLEKYLSRIKERFEKQNKKEKEIA